MMEESTVDADRKLFNVISAFSAVPPLKVVEDILKFQAISDESWNRFRLNIHADAQPRQIVLRSRSSISCSLKSAAGRLTSIKQATLAGGTVLTRPGVRDDPKIHTMVQASEALIINAEFTSLALTDNPTSSKRKRSA
jgi:hypothetical protein